VLGTDRRPVCHWNHGIPDIALKRSLNELLLFELNIILSITIRTIMKIAL